MPIEFNCNQCAKRLRTGDGTAGKQVRCPACGTVQTVPQAVSQEPAADDALFLGGAGAAFGPPTAPPRFPSPGGLDENPYAAPSAIGFGPPADRAFGPRTGPAWEHDGNSLASFFVTLRDVAISPRWFFSTMRRDGGLAGPLRFAALGGIIGCSFMALYGLVYQTLQRANVGGPPGAFGPPPGNNLGGLLGGFCCCSGIIAPLGTLAYVFAATGLFHGMLAVFGGARCGLETTLRAVAYSLGTMLLFGLVPVCGPHLLLIMHLVYLGIGLCFAHQTEGWKATLAVLLPGLFCGGGGIAVIVFLIASMGAN